MVYLYDDDDDDDDDDDHTNSSSESVPSLLVLHTELSGRHSTKYVHRVYNRPIYHVCGINVSDS